MTQIYNLSMFAVGTALIYIGWSQSDSGYLWNAALIVGGFYVGHVLTNVLDNPTDRLE
jgi:hypothetical protein